jgi:hypothetical protein
MRRIALIDDDPEYRTSMTLLITYALRSRGLQDEWDVLAAEPLEDKDGYGQWVTGNDITTILIDQRLDEATNVHGHRVNYHGDNAVGIIRQTHKDVPIYVVTSHSPAPALESHLGLFEGVIKKEDLSSQTEEYLIRIIRSSERFLASEEKRLSRLSELSEKIALNTATTTEKNEAKAIQEELYIPFTTTMLSKRAEWTEQYNDSINELEDLQAEIGEYLKQQASN